MGRDHVGFESLPEEGLIRFSKSSICQKTAMLGSGVVEKTGHELFAPG